MVPALDQPHPPCTFSPRCPLAEARCDQEPPQLTSRDDGRQLRCHFPGKPMPAGEEGGKRLGMEKDGEPSPLLVTRDLEVHFPIRKGILKRTVGHVRAVDGVDLRIPVGRTLGLVGESGCGKTTVGKGILQLTRPTGGQVMFKDTDLTSLKGSQLRHRRGEIQIIFQDPFSSMNPRMTIGDIVAEGVMAQGLEKRRSDCERWVGKTLERVGIREDAINRYPHEFSGGQRQRICIARALAVEPKLIICDEPTSALDVSVQAQILNLLADLQQQLGLSYLFITHNISAVAYIAHEVAVMYLGRIVESGPTEQILENPRHPYTRALLASVPLADPTARHEISPLPGDLPSPAAPPPGCHFHPRCPEASDECRQRYPAPRQLADGRMVKCFRIEA
jgi:peptide/nickel transport system ATP-binding protein